MLRLPHCGTLFAAWFLLPRIRAFEEHRARAPLSSALSRLLYADALAISPRHMVHLLMA